MIRGSLHGAAGFPSRFFCLSLPGFLVDLKPSAGQPAKRGLMRRVSLIYVRRLPQGGCRLASCWRVAACMVRGCRVALMRRVSLIYVRRLPQGDCRKASQGGCRLASRWRVAACMVRGCRVALMRRVSLIYVRRLPQSGCRKASASEHERYGSLAEFGAFRIGIDSELPPLSGGKPRAFCDTAQTIYGHRETKVRDGRRIITKPFSGTSTLQHHNCGRL